MSDGEPEVVGYVVSKPGSRKVIAYVVSQPPSPLPHRRVAKAGPDITGYVISKPGSSKVQGYVVTDKPPPRPRQHRAVRKVWITWLVIILLVLGAGFTEVTMHGFSFFAFRSGGVGSTPDSGKQEVQGPGQPNSNGKHGCTVNSVGTCLSPAHIHPRKHSR